MNNSLNFIKIQSNFNAKWALYSIIDSANLVEFEVGEGCINVCCKEEKYEENTTFGTAYLGNCWADSFQI